ncbi:hypothetical protein [Actinokineospora inagensis]|uniref:hypothetical protein n=1 Tax=Actinokineospora inagensis TaxID=103730 RepID=UPI0004233BF3|nr:hypothetical protein [Actinokineospora inagensis]
MNALIRYSFATTVHNQRFLAPVVLFFACAGVASGNNSGPLPGVYALNAGALLLCAAWLTIAVISVEDPAHRAITVVAANSHARVLAASVAVTWLISLALTVLGLALPLALQPRPVGAGDLPVGLLAHLLCASMGIAIGLLCSRLVFTRPGYALLTAMVLVAASLLTTGSPPNTVFKRMATATDSLTVLPTVAVLLPVGLAVLAVAAVATHLVSVRRD